MHRALDRAVSVGRDGVEVHRPRSARARPQIGEVSRTPSAGDEEALAVVARPAQRAGVERAPLVVCLGARVRAVGRSIDDGAVVVPGGDVDGVGGEQRREPLANGIVTEPERDPAALRRDVQPDEGEEIVELDGAVMAEARA